MQVFVPLAGVSQSQAYARSCPGQCTGEVRWVDLHAINSQLALGNVVVVNNLGFGFSGELLNCSAIDVGVSTAMALKVAALIWSPRDGRILSHRI